MDSSSIEKFRTLNFTTNKPTAAINYKFDFFTELPVEIEAAENIVQRFDVSVIIDQDFVEEDEDSIPLFIKTMSYGSNIRLKIEYSDYSVGRNRQVTIQDWVKNLTTRKVSPVFSFLNKRADFFNAYLPYFFASSSLYGLSRFYTTTPVDRIAQAILFSLCIAMIMWVIGKFLNVQFYRSLNAIKPISFIRITSGDKVRCDDFKDRQYRRKWISGLIGVTILLGIIVNLTSNYLFLAFTE